MKRLLLIAIGILTVLNLQAQTPKKAFNQNRQTLIEEGWDIVPFPGEYPTKTVKLNPTAAVNNWGEDLLLPDALRLRIKNECKNKVVVKIYDTAGKSSHSYLQKGQLPGKSYTGETNLEDGNGHGTHVGGIIAGKEFGYTAELVDLGLVQFKFVKVLTNSGSGQFGWFANAINSELNEDKLFIQNGTFVICNASLGGGTALVSEVETALKASTNSNVLWFVATGNTGTLGVQYPGKSQYVVGVGSLDNTNPLTHSSYTSYGPELYIGMPGRGINSSYLNNTFASLSGTSMATPAATGAAAIALSKWGAILANPTTMKNYLAWCATDLNVQGRDQFTGFGVEFIKNILDKNPKDMGNNPPPPPPPPVVDSSHAVRTLYFRLTGTYKMLWNNTLANGSEAKVQSQKEIKLNLIGNEWLEITGLEVVVPNSTSLSDFEYDKLIKNTNWFFNNRGIQLEARSDYNDAAYWSSYFYEMFLERFAPSKQIIDVVRIEVKNPQGKTSWISTDKLKHWPQL